MSDDDYDVIKDWELIAELTYRVKAVYSASTKEEAEKALRKRVKADNLVGVKVTSITHKPPLQGMGSPPGSPLRQVDEPDMPLHPPDPPKKATGGAGGAKKKGA